MGDGLLIIVLAIVLVILIPIVVIAIVRNQGRLKKMRAIIERLGYVITDGQIDPDTLGPFAISRLGNRGIVESSISFQVDDAAVTVFDYMSTTLRRHQGVTNAYRQTALLFESERLDLPGFSLRPETLGAKIQAARGQQDIDFQHHPSFSSAYLLQGSDETQIRVLFTDEKLDFFASKRGLCVEGLGQRLLYYRVKKVVSAKEFPSFSEEGLAVLHLLSG